MRPNSLPTFVPPARLHIGMRNGMLHAKNISVTIHELAKRRHREVASGDRGDL